MGSRSGGRRLRAPMKWQDIQYRYRLVSTRRLQGALALAVSFTRVGTSVPELAIEC